MKRTICFTIIVVMVFFFNSCESNQKAFTLPSDNTSETTVTSKPAAELTTPKPSVMPQVPAAPEKTVAEKKTEAVPTSPVAPKVATSPEQEKPKPVAKEAQAGLGKKAQNYKKHEFFGQIAQSFFRTRERMSYMTIQHEVDIYHADKGRYPKNMEEFQKEILDPSNTKLPELKEGYRYFYDSETGKLMIEEPID